MSKIIFELDEIEDIKNKLESIIQMGQKIDATESKELIKQNQSGLSEFLDDYEKKILEYIRKNPGNIKGVMLRSP